MKNDGRPPASCLPACFHICNPSGVLAPSMSTCGVRVVSFVWDENAQVLKNNAVRFKKAGASFDKLSDGTTWHDHSNLPTSNLLTPPEKKNGSRPGVARAC